VDRELKLTALGQLIFVALCVVSLDFAALAKRNYRFCGFHIERVLPSCEEHVHNNPD
jgi:hypothetical protein